MLCQNCKKAEATTFIKQSINGNVKQYYLCSSCAENLGFAAMMNPLGAFDLDIGNFLGNILGSSMEKEMQAMPSKTETDTCPLCGSTMHDFMSTGKAGCPQCYHTFGEGLRPVLNRIHGTIGYRGKIPNSAGKRISSKRKLEKLKAELAKAIEEQAFEKAAELRDSIKELEKGSDQFEK
jgi:protein arginine kinase activator